jgi:hypothetical protein
MYSANLALQSTRNDLQMVFATEALFAQLRPSKERARRRLST